MGQRCAFGNSVPTYLQFMEPM